MRKSKTTAALTLAPEPEVVDLSVAADDSDDDDGDNEPPSTNWRPPKWRDGIEDPNAPDDGHTPENTEDSYQQYAEAGYYTSGGKLSEAGKNAKDTSTAEDVSFNRRLLRDAWNTHPLAWRLGAALIGRPFRTDPFWNQGARGLPGLVRTLDGLTDDTDGYASDDNGFPINWRGDLPKGEAPADVNGPHSQTERWLRLCVEYGREEFCAAFVPDNGDGWFQNYGMLAHIVVRLGRVFCMPPPGIKSSSPRGASALLIWIPDAVIAEVRELSKSPKYAAKNRARLDELLPEATRGVLLNGDTFRVPMWTRPRKGMHYAYVQPGNVQKTVDFGLVETRTPAVVVDVAEVAE